MILITGASGKTGKALLKSFSTVGNVCAFVRRSEHIEAMQALGAEKVIVGDLRDEAAIRLALEGVRTVYHICPNMSPDEIQIGRLMIGEARQAGVEHFIYHSVLHPQTEQMHHHWQKLRVEELLFESGLPFTILQPAPYMQNWLAGWKSMVAEGVLRIPYSVHARFSFVDLADVAETAKRVVTEAGHVHATYELVGTNPMSHVEVAQIFARALQREVRAEKEALAEWESHATGLSAYALENLVRMFEYYDRWGLAGNLNVLRWLLGREPTSVEAFVDRIVKEQHANS